MALDLFKEVLPSILQTKESVIHDEVDEKSYNSFMVNRALSYHNDCLFYANEMNRWGHLPKAIQYQYLMSSIRSRKRPFVPWSKAQKDEDIELLMWYFGYSQKKAVAALAVMNDDQITEIRKMYDSIKESAKK